MEEAQEFNVPLDSELDVNSHDMLVSVERPKMLFNRQKYLGSLLTSSARYEHDGWFAGWWVHEFVLKSSGDNIVKRNGSVVNKDEYSLSKLKLNEHNYYKLVIDGKEVRFILQNILKNPYIGKDIVIEAKDEKNTAAIVKGKTTGNVDFNVEVNPYNASIINKNLGDDFVVNASKDGFFTEVSIAPDKNKHFVKIKLFRELEGFLYQQQGTVGTWQGAEYSFVLNNGAVSIKPDEQEHIQIKDVKQENDDTKVTYVKKGNIPVAINFEKEVMNYRGQFTKIEDRVKRGCLEIEALRQENNYTFKYVEELTDHIKTKKAQAVLVINLPVWLRLKCDFTCDTVLDAYRITGSSGDVTISRVFLAHSIVYQLKNTEASLQDFMNMQDMGLAWKMGMKADGIEDTLKIGEPFENNAFAKEFTFDKLGIAPLEKNEDFNKDAPLIYGDSEKYIVNMFFDWTRPPTKNNPTYIKNPKYKEGGVLKSNLPWKFCYVMPAFRYNVLYDEKKGIILGNVDEKTPNLSFDFSLPINEFTNPLFIKNPDYIPQEIRKQLNKEDIKSNIPWVLNYERPADLNFPSSEYFNWYPEDIKMCSRGEPFLSHGISWDVIDNNQEFFWGNKNKEIPNREYIPNAPNFVGQTFKGDVLQSDGKSSESSKITFRILGRRGTVETKWVGDQECVKIHDSKYSVGDVSSTYALLAFFGEKTPFGSNIFENAIDNNSFSMLCYLENRMQKDFSISLRYPKDSREVNGVKLVDIWKNNLVEKKKRVKSWILPILSFGTFAARIRFSKNDIFLCDSNKIKIEPIEYKDTFAFSLYPIRSKMKLVIENFEQKEDKFELLYGLSSEFLFFTCDKLKSLDDKLITDNFVQYPAWIETGILRTEKSKNVHCKQFLMDGQDCLRLHAFGLFDTGYKITGILQQGDFDKIKISIKDPKKDINENEWRPQQDASYVANEHEVDGTMFPGRPVNSQSHDYWQSVSCDIVDNVSVSFEWNVFNGEAKNFVKNDALSKKYKFTDDEISFDKELFVIKAVVKDITEYLKILRITKVVDSRGDCSGIQVASQQGNEITFNNGVKIDFRKLSLLDGNGFELQDAFNGTSLDREIQTYYLCKQNSAHFSFILAGVMNIEGAQQGVTSETIKFGIDGVNYECTPDKKLSNNILYKTTDIRTGEVKELYKRDTIDVSMYVKQFWSNTAKTENYWWYDKDRVIEMTQHEIIVWKKVQNEYDDWMGDKWEVASRVARSSIITSDVEYYNVTSSYETTPVMILLRVENHRTVSIQWYKLDKNNIFESSGKVEVSFNRATLGSAFTQKNALRTYSALQMFSVIKESRISSTCVGDSLLIGIAYTKGLDQWTIRIVGNSVNQIIHGYGYVGYNGMLTGGQLPLKCVDNINGFKETVYPFSDIKDLKEVPNKCFGDGKLVYFVYKDIPKIVTHILFKKSGNNYGFSAEAIELNNNYVTEYASTSQYYAAQYNTKERHFEIDGRLDDCQLTPLVKRATNDILKRGNHLVTRVFTNMLFQHIWYILLSLLNHTSGSYAYVWRNSAHVNEHGEIKPYDTVVYSKDYEIEIKHDPYELGFYYRLMIATLENQGEISRKAEYGVNIEEHGQLSLEDDAPEKTSAGMFYKINMDKIIKNNFQQNGIMSYMYSNIVEMATLDMFYSINDKIQCFAGPGFVNHRFVGICVVQSVTDLQCDIKHIDYFINYLSLASAMIHGTYLIAKGTYDLTIDTAKITAMFNPTLLGTGLSIGAAIGMTLAAASIVTMSIIIILRYIERGIESMIDAFSLRRTSAHIQATLIKYKLDIEGKHSYGQRSMDFIYPAFGAGYVSYTDEKVESGIFFSEKKLTISDKKEADYKSGYDKNFHSDKTKNTGRGFKLFDLVDNKSVTLCQVKCKGKQTLVFAPKNMAVIEGTQSILQTELFVDKDIGVPDPVFPPSIIHDYMINEQWKIGYTATDGQIISVSQDDTKILDGEPSNIVITSSFCGIASSYTAIEVKDQYDERYLRPVAMTPTAIALNVNKMNCVHENKVYHAFDGYSNRIVSWKGDVGCDREYLWQQYLFQQNDHFKRSNIFPPSQVMGSFRQKPVTAIECEDPIINVTQSYSKEEGFLNNTPGENKALKRFAIPVLSEPMSSLPAMVRTLQPYKLHTVEGITSLTTDIRNTQAAYKAPNSIDFNINGELYRATEEFICKITEQDGVVAVQDIVATEGMKFIGATTQVAFFYSPATRLYYSFTGGNTINKIDVVHRFKEIAEGKWDFVNQEVMLKSILPEDKPLVVRLDDTMKGEVYPPIDTVWRKEGDFKMLSMPGGLVYQGPKRCIINRFVLNSYMFDDIKRNKRKWVKLDKYDFYKERDYHWVYKNIETVSIKDAVKGWTHNPYKLATTMLGLSEEQDCKFEWSITFAWTKDIEQLYELNEYTTVCLQGETVTEGGTVLGEVTHVPLFKEQFTRKGDAGYYTFQFQSGNGIGNRERLYLWSDGIIAVESIKLSCKVVSQRRTQPLMTHVDVKDMIEQ